MENVDLLGRPLTDDETRLLEIYRTLRAIASQQDMPPCVEKNVKQALACMWQVVTDLNLEFEQLYDVGV